MLASTYPSALVLSPAQVGAVFGARLRRFRDDNRGAVMVTSLFFTFFLIGLCWFIFGIGNAITYRETLQNAADASAFGAAVYDARGMNLLATVNLIMASVLAVLVMVKIFQAIFIAVNIVSCLIAATSLGFNPLADAVCTYTSANEPAVNNVVTDVEKAVKATLTVLHYAETGIAVAWPWVAEGKSVLSAVPFQPKVLTATSFAYSQIPLGLDNAGSAGSINAVVGAVKGGGGVSGVAGALGGSILNGGSRLGLPVADESFDEFCDAGVVIAIDGLFSVFGLDKVPFVGKVVGWVLSQVEGLVEQFPGFFCGGGSTDTQKAAGSLAGKLNGVSADGTTVSTSSALKSQCSKVTQNPPIDPNTGKPITPAQAKQAYIQCMAAGTQTIPTGGLGSTSSLVPVVLYSDAKMGSDYYGIWSTAIGSFNEYASSKVNIAQIESKSPIAQPAIPDDANEAVAKAEFYYEPQNTTEKSSDETTIGKKLPFLNAMYNMRWRARLRRYHGFPTPANLAAVQDLIGGDYSGALSYASQVVGGEAGSLLPSQLKKLEGQLPSSMQSWLGGVTNPVSGKQSPLPNIIH